MLRAHGLSFGQAQALARIWLEVKARELAGHPEPLRGTFTVAAAVNQHPTRPPGGGRHTGRCVCPNLHHYGVFAPRTADVDVEAVITHFGGRRRSCGTFALPLRRLWGGSPPVVVLYVARRSTAFDTGGSFVASGVASRECIAPPLLAL
jgi:hypothetical protein